MESFFVLYEGSKDERGLAVNEQNLHILFQNYIEKFDTLDENYKWRAIGKVQECWNLDADNIADMIKNAFSLSYNIINNRIVQPVSGLVAIARVEQEKVRGLMETLLMDTKDVDRKQDQVLAFVDGCNTLLDKHFSGKWKYEQDVRAAIGYLGMIHPETDYLFKSSPAHFFARYMEYPDDIGYGKTFKLKKYYAMCEELLSRIKDCPELLAVDAGRPVEWKDPCGHVLTTDLIFCLGVYGLTVGMKKPMIKAKNQLERQRLERESRMETLQKELDELQKRAEALNDEIDALPFFSLMGLDAVTKAFGTGKIIRQEKNYIDVQTSGGVKTFSLPGCVEKGFLRFDSTEINERFLHEAELKKQVEQIEKQERIKVIELR